MLDIRLIDEDTDISKLDIHKVDWDVIVYGKPYQVAFIKGYVHSIGGRWGNNNLWMWPRDDEPTHDNLVEYSGDRGACQGIKYEPHNYLTHKWGESECFTAGGAMITRNGEDFYFCRGGIDEAKQLMRVLADHPADLNFYQFAEKMIGRKVWWRSEPAIITSWIGNGQACVILEPDGIEKFTVPPEFADEDPDYYCEGDVKTDIFDKHIWWWRE